jgi:hypothetical protein
MEEPKDAHWVERPAPPLDAQALRVRIHNSPEPENSDPTEIWYEAPGRLLMCSTSGAGLCGHWTSKFKRVGDAWVADGGGLTMCELRKK